MVVHRYKTSFFLLKSIELGNYPVYALIIYLWGRGSITYRELMTAGN
jgi:hypothetical protein